MRDRLRRVTGSVRVRVALVAMLLVGGVLVVSGIVLTRTVQHRLEEENRERADQTVAYAADRLEAGVAVDSVFATTAGPGDVFMVLRLADGTVIASQQPGPFTIPLGATESAVGRLGRVVVRLRDGRAAAGRADRHPRRRPPGGRVGAGRGLAARRRQGECCHPRERAVVGLPGARVVGRAHRLAARRTRPAPGRAAARHRRDDFAVDARTTRRRPTIPRRGRPAGDDHEHHARAAAAFPGPRAALRVGRLARAAQPAGEHPGSARGRRRARHR